MAADYGCDPNTVRRHLALAGIRAPRKMPERPSVEVLTKQVEAISEQQGPRRVTGALATEYGVTQTAIRQWLADAGLRSVKPRIPGKPILGPCPCGAVATTRYRGEDPPLCFRCYMRTYAGDKTSAFKRTGRLLIADLKRSAVCADCGGKFPPCCMDFDHVPERGPKLFNLSGNNDYSLERVRAEIEKCDIVCANCHRIRTWITRDKPWIKRSEAVSSLPPLDGALF
jgi:hypothetical protein